MRQSVALLLAPDAQVPSGAELTTLTATLRAHVALMIPEVESRAERAPKDDIPRYCALACVGEARRKLRALPPDPHEGDAGHARRLARALCALCDYYETLTGVRMCVACDQPILNLDDSLPYDQLSPSGHGLAARIHPECRH